MVRSDPTPPILSLVSIFPYDLRKAYEVVQARIVEAQHKNHGILETPSGGHHIAGVSKCERGAGIKKHQKLLGAIGGKRERFRSQFDDSSA